MNQVYETDSSETTQELLEALGQDFDLGAKTENAERFVTHQDHLILRFDADGQRYFLKQWGDGTAERKRLFLQLQAYLQQQNFTVPKTLATKTGQVLWPWRDKSYQVHEYIGEAYDYSLAHQQRDAFALALGRFHALGQQCPHLASWREMDREKLLGCWADLDPRLGFAQEFLGYSRRQLAGSTLSAAAAGHVGQCLDQMDQLLERARVAAAGWYSLPQVPVHGDFGLHNCRFSGTELVGVIDWDTARLAPRLLDVAYAINMAVGWSAEVKGFFDFRWKDAVIPQQADIARWLDLYRQGGPQFSDEEIALLPPLCAAYWLTSSCGRVPLQEEEVDGCEQVVHFMRYWLDAADELSIALR
jgi:Ser/Thr protein kinase RdoA (MazF antagonist)